MLYLKIGETQGMQLVKLDLHGTKHADAKNKVIRFIEKHWGTGVEAEFITGHSTKMKGIVLNTLDEYKLSYTIGRMFEPNAPRIISWME
jgi:DNA-nicking Smr family endonuclease